MVASFNLNQELGLVWFDFVVVHLFGQTELFYFHFSL